MVINWVFLDLDSRYLMTLSNCALNTLADRASDQAEATVTLERRALEGLILRETTIADALQDGLIVVDGDSTQLTELFCLFDDFTAMFEIVEPKTEP